MVMETQKNQEKKEKVADKEERGGEEKSKQEGKEAKSTKQQSSPSTINNPPSPPSVTSSPSHEFSFTISLQPSSTIQEKTRSQSSFAIDLSPADDIFFHGHLLPLHLLSHVPVSPRSSINSIESFTIPIKDSSEDRKPNNESKNINTTSREIKERTKIKSFPLFGLAKWRKGYEREEDDSEEEEKKKNKKKKLRFEVTQTLKRYARMVSPLAFFKGENKDNHQFRKQSYSFSGLSSRGKQEWKGRRAGEFSAPVSMRTSPTNSGLLVATKTLPSSTSDSSMEELQNAIQAAITHCKNSIAVKERNPHSEITVE